MKSKNQKNGFTLVEMLIAVTVFSVAAVIIGAIFINSVSIEQRTANYQKLQSNGRYILEKIAKEARGREIKLKYPAENPADGIEFLPDEFNEIVYINATSTNGLNDFKYCSFFNDNLDCDNLNSRDVNIEYARFYVFPTKLKNRDAGKYTQELILQTTISSKTYKR